MIGVKLAHAPRVEIDGHDFIAQPLLLDHGGQLGRQRLVVAKDRNRPLAQLCEVLGAITQDQRFARTRHAVNHAMPFPQAARQLLLLQVHDTNEIRDFRTDLAMFFARICLNTNTHFRKHMPAHTVDLRQRQLHLELDGEHAP